MQIDVIKVLIDNYVWVLHDDNSAVVIDPGVGADIFNFLKNRNLDLDAILITHHHADHCGGVAYLQDRYPEAKVYAPCVFDSIVSQVVKEGDTLEFFSQKCSVLELPGHTLDHVGYIFQNHAFIADVLFKAGCGRLFEGSVLQMLDSLNKLKSLPLSIKLYPAHEYSVSNMEFAVLLDPDNKVLRDELALDKQRLLSGQITLPTTLELELMINPFLRCGDKKFQELNGIDVNLNNAEELTFAKIRLLKDKY